jgi:hypothetical protein
MREGKLIMAIYRSLAAALVISGIGATSASAQFSEPAAYEAMHPDRDVLNGGALTPAARMGLERPGGVAPIDANAYQPPDQAIPAHRRHHRR